MRVAVDATPLIGPRTGIGRYTLELVKALSGRVEVVLTPFTARGAGALLPPPGTRVRHVPVPARGLQLLWAHSELPLVEWLSGPCDVFHGTNFVLPPTRRAAGVVTIHDLTFLFHPDTVTPAVARYRELVPRSIARAKAVITPSAAVAGEVSEAYGVELSRIVVTPHGVDAAWSSAKPPDDAIRRTRGLPERYVLFVGTREPRKNLAMLVRAHARAHREQPDVVPPLLLVGPPGWGSFEMADGVHTLGYLHDDELHSIVAGAALAAIPSRYEGFGLPVLEALATGIPVLASDIPALREVGGEVIDYADWRDEDAWVAGLLATLSADPARGLKARQEQASHFTWQRSAELTLAAYKAIA